MQREKVKIKLIMTLMTLAILWGINTSAGVINQWMARTVAPQIFDVERIEDRFEVEVLGYSFLIGKETWDNLVYVSLNELDALEKTADEVYQKILPMGKDLAEKAIQEGHEFLKECLFLWNKQVEKT